MGGDRETLVPQSRAGSSSPATIGNLRVHESAGQVHFHDDTSKPKRKVAVRSADWYAAWQKLSGVQVGSTEKWSYTDPSNKAAVVVQTKAFIPDGGDTVQMTAEAAIYPVESDDVFAKLEQFTRPK